ncbi:MAG: T9SS type A sorting domain-containing protein [Flavobacterium sp.]|nr:T9SS type A sorting domain-containing protein [Flavobacterium sp.]
MKKITLLLLLLVACWSYGQGDTCADAIDLNAETSPYVGTTVGAVNDSATNCNNSGATTTNTAGDLYFKIVVPNGSTLTIGQQVNGYDSTNMAYYGDCENVIELLACNDDDDLEHVTWANTTGTDQTVYWIQDGYTANEGTFTLEWSVIACAPASATYTVISDCGNGEQFNVSVEVTDMGSATSITVSDDQGSAPQLVATPGVVLFGPFSNGTQVVFSVANDQDSDCTLTSPIQTQATCPPNCANATVISACGEVAVADIVAGNGAWNPYSCFFDTPGTELLYSFTPAETGAYVLEVLSATGGYIDYFYKEASGSCDGTGWICIDDNSGAGTDPIGTLVAGTTYYILLDSEGTSARNQTFQIQCLPTCTNATVVYTVVSDCGNGEQFNVNVDITNMGTAVSNTIADDQGSAPQIVTEASAVVFGPYPNNTPVIFTVSNNDDNTCVLTSPVQNQTACPPANDNFADAVAVECGLIYTGSTALATVDEANAPVGYGVTGTSKNVWYKFTGSGAAQTVTLSLCPSEYDTAVLVYVGESGNLTAIAGNDDNGTACPNATTRTQLNFNSDGTTTYYIDLRGYGAFSSGNYSMEVTCAEVTPPAVENQACDTALNVATDGSDTMSDNSFGDVSPVQPTCDPFGSVQDVWFSFVATDTAADVTLENGTMTSLNFNIYSGSCDALVPIANTCNTNLTTPTTENLTGLVVGTTYYVQVWSNAVEQGTFVLRVLSQNLGVGAAPFAGFSYSPNPVKDVLYFNHTQNITNVAVYNLLGQQVIAKTTNANQSQVDMSKLSAGTYVVKVTADNQVKTIKVIKE